jgi:hypothetical protein
MNHTSLATTYIDGARTQTLLVDRRMEQNASTTTATTRTV